MIIELGSFEVKSGVLVVSDPCYDLDLEASYMGVVEQAVNGVWHGIIERIDAGDWGERCSAFSR